MSVKVWRALVVAFHALARLVDHPQKSQSYEFQSRGRTNIDKDLRHPLTKICISKKWLHFNRATSAEFWAESISFRTMISAGESYRVVLENLHQRILLILTQDWIACSLPCIPIEILYLQQPVCIVSYQLFVIVSGCVWMYKNHNQIKISG